MLFSQRSAVALAHSAVVAQQPALHVGRFGFETVGDLHQVADRLGRANDEGACSVLVFSPFFVASEAPLEQCLLLAERSQRLIARGLRGEQGQLKVIGTQRATTRLARRYPTGSH